MHYCLEFFQDNKMVRCQCLTKEGKGSQCTRQLPEGERFCWQHRDCRTPVVKSVPLENKSTEKVDVKTYLNIIPRELIEELLILLPFQDLVGNKEFWGKYLTRQFWIKRLSRKSRMPPEAFIDLLHEPDDEKFMIFTEAFDENAFCCKGNYVFPYNDAITFGYLSIVKYMNENKLINENPTKSLHFVQHNPIQMVEYLESIGADIHYNTDTFLEKSIQNDNYPLVKHLIDRGFMLYPNIVNDALVTFNPEIIKLIFRKRNLSPLNAIIILPNELPPQLIKDLIDFSFTLPDPVHRTLKDFISLLLYNITYKPKIFDYILSLNQTTQETLDKVALISLNTGLYEKALYFKKHGAQVPTALINQKLESLLSSPGSENQRIMFLIDLGATNLDEAFDAVDKDISHTRLESNYESIRTKRDPGRLQRLLNLREYIVEKMK